jgi:hypothetical protein
MVTINQLAEMAIKAADKRAYVKNIDGEEFKAKYGFKCPIGVRGRNSDNNLYFEKMGVIFDRPLQEGIKTDITRRSKSQQFNQAAKLANKKLKEVNSILEYAAKLKVELNEVGNAPSTRLMEKIKVSVIEAYKKIKEL